MGGCTSHEIVKLDTRNVLDPATTLTSSITIQPSNIQMVAPLSNQLFWAIDNCRKRTFFPKEITRIIADYAHPQICFYPEVAELIRRVILELIIFNDDNDNHTVTHNNPGNNATFTEASNMLFTIIPKSKRICSTFATIYPPRLLHLPLLLLPDIKDNDLIFNIQEKNDKDNDIYTLDGQQQLYFENHENYPYTLYIRYSYNFSVKRFVMTIYFVQN